VVTSLSAPAPSTLTFATRDVPSELPALSCVIAKERPSSAAWIRSASPRLDFIRALLVLERVGRFERATAAAQIHPTAVIAPGVSIGKRAIVAPGAVVTDDVPESTMVAGSPARVVLQLEDSPESGLVAGESSESSGPETTRSPGLRVAS